MAEPRGKKPSVEDWLNKDGEILVRGWCRDGLTEKQIAKNMGIGLSTLRKWKIKNETFGNYLKTSKEVVDKEVENSLYKLAMGFEYDEITEERVFNPLKGKFEMVVTKKVHKVALPSTTAQIFWLKNRKPDIWQDRRQLESTEALDKLDGILSGIRAKAKEQVQNIDEDAQESK